MIDVGWRKFITDLMEKMSRYKTRSSGFVSVADCRERGGGKLVSFFVDSFVYSNATIPI